MPLASTASDGIGGGLPPQDASTSGQFLTSTTTGNLTTASWASVGGAGITVGTFGSTPTANGMTASGTTLTGQPADGTHPGFLTAGAQTIGGAKTLAATPILSLGIITSGVASGAPGFQLDVASGNTAQDMFQVTRGGAGPYFSVDDGADTHVFGTIHVGGGVVALGAIGAGSAAFTGDLESDTVGGGLIIKSLDGTRWRILVANTTGALTTSLA